MISCAMYLMISATIGRTIGMESLGLKFAMCNSASNKAPTYGMASARLRRSLLMYMPLILAVIWSIISEFEYDSKSIDSQKNGFSEEDFEFRQQYQERSRGRERRMIHERLRQQMFDRATELDVLSSTRAVKAFSQQPHQQTELRRDDVSISERAMSLSPLKLFVYLMRHLIKVGQL